MAVADAVYSADHVERRQLGQSIGYAHHHGPEHAATFGSATGTHCHGASLRSALMLGAFLAVFGFLVVWLITEDPDAELHLWWPSWCHHAACWWSPAARYSGSMLPLMFKRLGLDPALMSNPFVAGLSDILAIVIYMSVALTFLGRS